MLLVSNDGDFVEGVEGLLDGRRRVGVVGFTEFRNHEFAALVGRGLELIDLEYDVEAFTDAAAPGPDHPDRRVRPARVPLTRQAVSRSARADRPASSRATGTRNGEQET